MSRHLKNDKNRGVNLACYINPKSPVAEQYRLIKNNLQFSSVDKEIKTLVVTSPEPSDGKSTTAANLAIVLAQYRKRVLLVDADLRKPSVHYSFNLSNLDGLTNVLTKEINLEEAIAHTNDACFDILPCGPIPPNPSELMDSKAMDHTLEKLKGLYDLIIFDTPPLLAVTDSLIMANKCDGVVLVVASGKTKKDKAIKAKNLLEKANSQLLGVVVNGVREKANDYYGQYLT